MHEQHQVHATRCTRNALKAENSAYRGKGFACSFYHWAIPLDSVSGIRATLNSPPHQKMPKFSRRGGLKKMFEFSLFGTGFWHRNECPRKSRMLRFFSEVWPFMGFLACFLRFCVFMGRGSGGPEVSNVGGGFLTNPDKPVVRWSRCCNGVLSITPHRMNTSRSITRLGVSSHISCRIGLPRVQSHRFACYSLGKLVINFRARVVNSTWVTS